MNDHSPFIWTPEDLSYIETVCSKYPPQEKKSALIPLLLWAQDKYGGWLFPGLLEATAHVLSLPLSQVYEVATFYTMLHTEPVASTLIEVCDTTPCWLKGSEALLKCAKKWSKNKEDTEVRTIPCLGACAQAPLVKIGPQYYENLTPKTLESVLEEHRIQAQRRNTHAKT